MGYAPQVNNLTTLSLNRAIAAMALPAIGWMVVEGLYHLVDAFWIGKLGAGPFAAASATSFLLWMLFAFADLFGIATSTYVAQSVGAKQIAQVPEHLRIALVATSLLGAAIALAFYTIREPVFGLLGLEPQVCKLALEYLLPWLVALPLFFVARLMGHVFRGLGDARTLMFLMSGALPINTGLAPCLIFGLGPFPELGLVGAACSTAICELLIVIAGIAILRRRGLFPRFSGISFLALPTSPVAKMMRVGLPIALNGALFSMTYIGLTWVISKFGSSAVAAIGIGHRMESWPWFLCYGFSVAAATLVGQYLGAGQSAKAAQAVWRCVGMAAVCVVVYVALVWLWIEPVLGAFIADPQVVELAAVYLRLVSICWLPGLLELVLQGAFSGAGHTLPPLIIGLPLTLLRIPASYVLAITFDLGPLGIWLAIGLSMAIKGVLLLIWWQTGSWRHKKLLVEVKG